MPTSDMKSPVIQFRNKDMEAYLQLPSPQDGEVYTVEWLKAMLEQRGVVYGVLDSALEKMLEEKIYFKETLVAKGTPVVDGIDGYYDYNFNPNCDRKPKILPDGSVDYWTVHSIESVVAGQVIAIYHPVIPGTNGTSVRGAEVIAKRGKEQALLKGKGFERTTDNLTYTSLIDGKIEMQNGKILIVPIHEMYGNAEMIGGNIDFHGDVVIHGSVESGVTIKASGSITIDGVVESANLEAGKDIILRSGMLGGNKAVVKTKGNIFAKFFEYTTVEADGMIQADVLMNCHVNCKERILLNGSHGSIIGGDIHAAQGIDAYSIGNSAETKTEVYAGAGDGIIRRLKILEKKVAATQEGLKKIEEGLRQFDKLELERGVSYANDPRRMSLLRVRIRDTAITAADQAEIEKLRSLVDSAKGAVISVSHEVFPGVLIAIDDAKLLVKNRATGVEFYRFEDKIRTRGADIGVE